MSTKQSQNFSTKPNTYLVDGKDIHVKQPAAPYKMLETKYKFNRAMTKNMTKKRLSYLDENNRLFVPHQTSSSSNLLKVTI